ncbi:MAG: solute carrier family 26 protein [Deltaproteobacteria bacterium]|nr:solute carrier family 26 protein [Deltaproteobacteria bacterium]NND29009.1 solute carrier family 26 protein [Myxococcales bacterium]NNK07780.1 solute carrier family 26 protein [Myxococcales bacterium]
MSRAVRALPIFGWLRSYQRADLGPDVIAGLTTAVMLVPQAMGYALLAGLPPIVGLYASVAPLLLYAALGTSRHLAVGPVAMDSILVAGAVAAIATLGAEQYVLIAAALGMMVGVVQAGLGFLRAGFLVNFLSRPVVAGFTAAAALIIAASQLGHLLGIDVPRTHHVHRVVWEALRGFSEWSWPTLALGAASVMTLVVSKKRWPRLPAALVVVVVATLVVWALGLSSRGVSVVGDVPAGLPGFLIPTVDTSVLVELIPAAATIALVSFMEAISVGRTFAQRFRYDIDPNRELIALGLANLAGGATGGYPIAGGFSRTAVNVRAGARTQVAALVTCAVVIVTLLFLTRAFFYLPKAALSAIIVAAVAGLIDIRGAREVYRVKRTDFYLLVLTFIATLSLGIQWGILVGVGASVLLFLVRTTRPHFAVLGRVPESQTYLNLARHPHAETLEGIILVRVDAQFYFGNVSFLKETVRSLIDESETPVRYFVLEAAGVNDLDSAAAATLDELDEELAARGVKLVLTRIKGPVRDVLHRTGLLDKMAREGRLYLSTHRAIEVLRSGMALPDLSPEGDDPRAAADQVGCGMLNPEAPDPGKNFFETIRKTKA